MPAPAVNITTAASPVPRSSPTDTGVAHIVGMSTAGPAARLLTEADKITSLNDWIDRYGGTTAANARLSYSVDYDWIESFFREGGNALYYGRVVGPSPVYASINLAGTGTTLVVTADEYGSHFNQYKIQVTNGGSGSSHRIIKLLESDGTTLIEETPEFDDRTDVSGVKLGVSANKPVTITLGGGSGLPTVAAATALSSGTDDRASITQTQVDAALAFLTADLGPGQVASPNWQTSTAHLSLLSHAATYNRFALCDPVDTTTKSTIVTNADALQGTTNGAYGALYAPWVTIPALASGGTERSIPPSALVAGRIAVNDPVDTPSQAPAGRWGTTNNWATSVKATWARIPAGTSDADDLADAGVNLVVTRNGAVTIYDILSLAAAGDEFEQIGVARWRMQTVALIGSQADSEIFARVNRNTLTAWKAAADAILLRQYNDGQLFGDLDDDRPETAFNTDVDTPNTAATINAGEMNLNVAARPVKGGRILNISITAVPLTAPVA